MRLSDLQQYILKTALDTRGRVDRGAFLRYYKSDKKAPSAVIQTKIITKSMLRLIDKELMIGFGHRTKHRWFVESLELTPFGRAEAQKLYGKQQELPLKKTRTKRKKK
ncbi:MAG: hypothetical protein ABIG66_01835 [Candidatus Kerfeldbacteria bacterium]